PRDLTLLERRVIGGSNDGLRLAIGEPIHADDHRLAALDAKLMLVRRSADLLLEKARFDRARRAAAFVHLREQRHRRRLERVRELLHVVASREGIGGERRATLEA